MRLNEITKDEFVTALKDPRRLKIENQLKEFADQAATDEQPYDVTWEWGEDWTSQFCEVYGVARIPIRYTGRNSPVLDPVMDYMLDVFETEYYEDVLGVSVKIEDNQPGKTFSFVLGLNKTN